MTHASMDTGNCGCGETGIDSQIDMGNASKETGPLIPETNPATIEQGFDGETHGGGQLETVAGFDVGRAMVDVIGTMESSALPRNYGAMLDAGTAHYEGNVNLRREAPESVCGRDDRAHISNVTQPPWRMTAQLFITAANGDQYVGTGWFIAPTILVTAGHCVHSGRSGGWAQQIEVVPGMNGRHRPFGSAVSKQFRSVRGWVNNGRVEEDYACIILPDAAPLGEKTGWFGFASFSDAKLKNSLINTSGYPADKSIGTQWFNGGRLTEIEPQRLHYLVDTFGGQSGSAVWHNEVGTRRRYAVGIHNYGGCNNKATRINDEVFDVLKAWKAMGI
ncbi:extracellular metalloprotease [Roseobacter cerasinus]|uniref:Serine protease n=1 Tax=Roseobacter cerasinus TaxID=2602289 RepID=A0A640VN21_9RHOB|nr:trypsin-like serine protease [Roseobacter cerasinus]GFE49034.1 extracellular metalloprotease [Roseobacter cerasinus]